MEYKEIPREIDQLRDKINKNERVITSLESVNDDVALLKFKNVWCHVDRVLMLDALRATNEHLNETLKFLKETHTTLTKVAEGLMK